MRKEIKREMGKLIRTSKVAEILGVSAQTVVNWSNSGTLKEFRRTPTGFRLYDEDEIKKLAERGAFMDEPKK